MNWIGTLAQCEIGKNDTVLELGCGVMQATMDTCSCYPPTKLKCKTYVGVDGFQDYVDFLNTRGDVKAIKHNLLDLPYPFSDKSFDVVLVIDVLEHLPSLDAANKLLWEAIRIARKAVIIYTPETFFDNKATTDRPSYPYSDFGGNALQEHHIVIAADWLRQRLFSVKKFKANDGVLYGVLNLKPNFVGLVKRNYRYFVEDSLICLCAARNKVYGLYIRVFHNHETSRTHWEYAARINPFKAVCTSANNQDDLSKIRDSVLFHGGIDYKGKKVLDVCCGVGRIASFISKEAESYIGVDWSKTMVETANNMHRDETNVAFVVNNGIDLSCLPDNTFDIAVCELAFQHMKKESTQRYVSEVLRVLKSGGVFLAQLPRRDYYDQFPEYKGRGYELEEAKGIFKGYGDVIYVDGYNHNYAYFLIKAFKEKK